MAMSLSAVQQKFVAKCESKCQGGTTVARQLRKMFQQVDLDNDGLVNIREWAAVVEATNGAISQDEACALFEFWDTAGYARDPNGAVSVSEAIASLMSSEVQSEAVFDDRGRGAPPPSRGGESDGAPREQQWNGNKGNRPSAPGGIFGGGVYESDQQRAEVDQQRAQADRAMALRQHEQVQPVNRPKNNESSLAGGIFGGPMADDTPRQGVEKKNYSNRSSLDGGVPSLSPSLSPSPGPSHSRGPGLDPTTQSVRRSTGPLPCPLPCATLAPIASATTATIITLATSAATLAKSHPPTLPPPAFPLRHLRLRRERHARQHCAHERARQAQRQRLLHPGRYLRLGSP